MNIKIYYYNPFITLNGQKTNIPFYRLLDKIRTRPVAERFKLTRHGEYSLLRMRDPRANRDISDRFVCFADYRARKPKLGEKGSDRFEDIQDDVFESTNCFFQSSENLFIIEYNHYGAKCKQIEEYLSKFLPSTETHNWGVELIELEPRIGLTDVIDSNDIRSLDLKLDVTSNQRNQLIQQGHNEQESLVLNVLNDIVDAQEEIGGNIAQLYIGNGRKKDNLLNSDAVKNFIRLIDYDSDLFMSIKIKYFSPSLGKVHEIDIKNASILKSEIEAEGDAWETIADAMEEHFYDAGRLGNGQNARHLRDIRVIPQAEWI